MGIMDAIASINSFALTSEYNPDKELTAVSE